MNFEEINFEDFEDVDFESEYNDDFEFTEEGEKSCTGIYKWMSDQTERTVKCWIRCCKNFQQKKLFWKISIRQSLSEKIQNMFPIGM